MPLKILTGDEKCQKDYNKKFKETHSKDYYAVAMRKSRRRKKDKIIQNALKNYHERIEEGMQILFNEGKEE